MPSRNICLIALKGAIVIVALQKNPGQDAGLPAPMKSLSETCNEEYFALTGI